MSYFWPAVDPVFVSVVRTDIKITLICQFNSTEATYIKTSTVLHPKGISNAQPFTNTEHVFSVFYMNEKRIIHNS